MGFVLGMVCGGTWAHRNAVRQNGFVRLRAALHVAQKRVCGTAKLGHSDRRHQKGCKRRGRSARIGAVAEFPRRYRRSEVALQARRQVYSHLHERYRDTNGQATVRDRARSVRRLADRGLGGTRARSGIYGRQSELHDNRFVRAGHDCSHSRVFQKPAYKVLLRQRYNRYGNRRGGKERYGNSCGCSRRYEAVRTERRVDGARQPRGVETDRKSRRQSVVRIRSVSLGRLRNNFVFGA